MKHLWIAAISMTAATAMAQHVTTLPGGKSYVRPSTPAEVARIVDAFRAAPDPEAVARAAAAAALETLNEDLDALSLPRIASAAAITPALRYRVEQVCADAINALKVKRAAFPRASDGYASATDQLENWLAWLPMILNHAEAVSAAAR